MGVVEQVVQVLLRDNTLCALSDTGSLYYCQLSTKPKPVSASGPQPSLQFNMLPGFCYFILFFNFFYLLICLFFNINIITIVNIFQLINIFFSK